MSRKIKASTVLIALGSLVALALLVVGSVVLGHQFHDHDLGLVVQNAIALAGGIFLGLVACKLYDLLQ